MGFLWLYKKKSLFVGNTKEFESARAPCQQVTNSSEKVFVLFSQLFCKVASISKKLTKSPR